MKFEMTRTIHFSDTDKEGIMYFARLPDMAHQALENHLLKKGLWKTWFSHSDYAVPIKAVQMSFERPMRAGESFTIQGTLSEKSKHSVTFEFEFLKEGLLCAQLKSTHVFVDRASGKKAPIPDWAEELFAN